MKEQLPMKTCAQCQVVILIKPEFYHLECQKGCFSPYSRGFGHFHNSHIFSYKGYSKNILWSFVFFLRRMTEKHILHQQILKFTF